MKVKLSILLAILFLPQTVLAEYDPPGPPAVEVKVWLVSFTPLENFDDGWNGKSDIRFEASADPKKGGEGFSLYFEYDHDRTSGKLVPVSGGKPVRMLLYKEKECWPIDLEVEIKATDVDNPPVDDDDFLGSAKLKVDSDLQRLNYNVIIPGKFAVKVFVEAIPVKEDSEKCSYFYDQPDTMSSSLVTKSGANIYDWELANMLRMWIADRGFANMLVIFQQCFGGGMADDILEKIDGDVAILTAAKHDEYAYGINDSSISSQFTREVVKGFKDGKTAKEVSVDAEKNDAAGPYNRKTYYDDKQREFSIRKKTEHPQFVSKGEGDRIVPGKKTDGGEAKSKHAIIFDGDASIQGDWADIQNMINLLKSRGFKDEDIIVLADKGKDPSKPFVDGPGTKKALWDALREVSKKMNEDEQFVFYVTNHGNLERTERALEKVINDPVRQPVPPANEDAWTLDDEFLAILNSTDENRPYVSLIVVPEELGETDFLSGIVLYLNGEVLEAELIEPVYALDEIPDLDGYELVYPISEDVLGRRNVIEVEYAYENFQPFTIEILQISTGEIPRPKYELEILEEVSEDGEDVLSLDGSVLFDFVNEIHYYTDPDLTEDEIDAILGQDLFTQMVEKINWYNNNTHLVPGFLKFLVGNSRVNLEIEMNDGSTMETYFVTQNAYVTEFEKGRLPDATGKAKTREDTVRKILASEDPIKEIQNAIQAGEISYSGVGFFESFKVEVVKMVARIFLFISDLVG